MTCAYCEHPGPTVCATESDSENCPRRPSDGVAAFAEQFISDAADAFGMAAGAVGRAAVVTAEVTGAAVLATAEVAAEVATDVITGIADAALD